MLQVLKGAKLFDVNSRDLIEDALIIIAETGRIEAVGSTDELQIPQAQDIRVYDLQGKYILPGLIDTHIHIGYQGMANTFEENLVDIKLRTIRAAKEMEDTLMAGFTTVRNCGSVEFIDVFIKDAIGQGLVQGPKILTCGEILSITCAGTEYFENLYRVCDGYDQFKKAARLQLKMGADLLKVMASGAIMNPGGVPGAEQPDIKELEAIVEEATKLGKKVAAHAHGAQSIKSAIKAGVATIEHGSLADDEALKLMVEHNVYLVPTLLAGYFMIQKGVEAGVPEFMLEKTKKTRPIRVNTVQRAIEAGVKVAMGSDAGVSPYNNHGKNAHEMLVYVKEGLMSSKEAIVSATKTAAEACGLERDIGTLEKGKLADIIVVDENPLDNVEILTKSDKIRMVFKEGKLVKNLDK